MNKREFLESIRSHLADLPEEDIKKSLDYYSEMIEDKIEEGIAEEAAIKEIGTPDEAASQILMDTSFPSLVKAAIKPKKRLSVLTIILIILGSPIWLSILIAILAILLSIYIVLWSVILVLYAVDLSFAAVAVAGFVSAAVYMFKLGMSESLFTLGIAVACAGLAILTFFGSNQVTKGLTFISKKMIIGIKSCFVRRRESK